MRGTAPDAFAAVMATGIVSVAAADHGLEAVSVPLAVLGCVGLPVLMYLTAVTWRREGWSLDDVDTAVALLTYVAACCVLVGRFDGHPVAVWILGPLAVQGWLSLIPVIARGMWRLRWTGLRERAHGAWELVSVSTSALALLCAAADVLSWSLILWVSALLAYVAMTALVAWRAVSDPTVRRGAPPDLWIVMGGAAIATLAGEHLHALLSAGPLADVVRSVTVVTWGIATAWLVPLMLVGWRRMLAWPAVFPVGMYASATYAVAGETGWSWLVPASLALTCIAVALWLATFLRFVHDQPR